MKVKLEEILQEISEKTTQNNQYPVLTSSKAGLYLQSDYFNKQVASKDNTGYKIIKRGQFTYRAMSDTGEFFPNMLDCADIGIVSPAYPVFEIIDEFKIKPKYLSYFFKSDHFQFAIASFAQGSTRTSIKFNKMKTVSINLPTIEEQEKIVAVLEKVKEIIVCRQNQLQKLDELVKARFVEMFGTIHDNKFGFDIVTLQEVSAPIKDGTHQTPTYTNDTKNGYMFLSSKDVTTGKIDWSNLKYIPEYLHQALYSRIAPRIGDILLAKNGTTGIAAIVDRDEVFDIYVSLALIRPIGVNTTYLWAAINAPETKQQFDASLKGIGVPNLHLGEIKKARIILPPIERQEQFAAFVEQVDKSKLLKKNY